MNLFSPSSVNSIIVIIAHKQPEMLFVINKSGERIDKGVKRFLLNIRSIVKTYMTNVMIAGIRNTLTIFIYYVYSRCVIKILIM